MNAGRNDPCPCGSGHKYKNCCLAKEDADRARTGRYEVSKEERQAAMQAAFDALTDFGFRAKLNAGAGRAFRTFAVDAPPPGADPDDVQFKFWWYWHFDAPAAGGRSLVEQFLASDARSLPAAQRSLLQRLAPARLRLYEVQEVRPDEGLALLDLHSAATPWVRQHMGTHQIARWDVVALRLAPVEDGVLELYGGAYLFHPEHKRDLLSALRREERALQRAGASDDDALFRRFALVAHRRWLDLFRSVSGPSLVTAEGDPVEFTKSLFDIRDEAALRAAIGRRPDFADSEDGYTWIEPLSGGQMRALGHLRIADGHLIVEATSRARADRVRAVIEVAAGDAVRYRTTRYESVESALRSERDHRPLSPVEPTAEAAQVVRGLKDSHYRSWPDTPLPPLGGRTPRHAARLKTIRPRLIDLLKEMQRHEDRAATPNAPAYDFEWIWRELGLEASARP